MCSRRVLLRWIGRLWWRWSRGKRRCWTRIARWSVRFRREAQTGGGKRSFVHGIEDGYAEEGGG